VREWQEQINLNGESFECVEEFPYLGDTIGGADANVVARINSGWGKFMELLPLLTLRGLLCRSKGNLYMACVRSVMLYSSETWAINEENICR